MLVLDTNIILNDHENLEILSQQSENILILPEIVLDELDTKKSGLDEINFQARAFGRLFSAATVRGVRKLKDLVITETYIDSDKCITIWVVSKLSYRTDSDGSIPNNIRNDRKIIEIAQDLKKDYEKVVFISFDNMARYRALSLGVETRKFELNEKQEVVLYHKLEMEETKQGFEVSEIEDLGVPKSVQGLEVVDGKGSHFYYRVGNFFKRVDETEIKRQNISPRNVGQKIFSSQILDDFFDVVVSDSPAGSGKTLIALSNAMRLLDTNKDKYDKIVYIRKTVISDTEELGFMPGSLEEKMSGYLAPLYSNIEFIVENKYKKKDRKISKEEFEKNIEKMVERYQIEALYEGHLRGGNIRNAVVILDEFQNNSISSAKTIITRIGENCKVIILGSNRQIDSKYLNKFNNALTYLVNKIGEDTMGVNLTGYTLTKTIRSPISEWADTFKG